VMFPGTTALIDRVNEFLVEGSLFPSDTSQNKPGDFVILTADSPTEMAKWLVAFFDSFKLYGRPKELLYDFKDPASPLFAVPTEKSNVTLFLTLQDVEHVDVSESSADVRAEFAEIV